MKNKFNFLSKILSFINARLSRLAKKTGYTSEGFLKGEEDVEDLYVAADRVQKRARRVSLEQVRKEIC